jgi:hypothetical protein
MTHGDGFIHGYMPAAAGELSCCVHDPGLELHRTIGGTDWVLETKVSYHMPPANGRLLDLRIYFGDGGVGTVGVTMGRYRDIGHESLIPWLHLFEKTGPSAFGDRTYLESTTASGALGATSDFTNWFRLERAGGLLTASWSDDGLIWNPAWSHDFGTALDGLDQRVVITGHSWFVPSGSFADYDYISVEPTVAPVSIDVKPGSFPNSINLRNRGVVPVAILTTADFNATTVDASTVRFGETGTEAAPVHFALEDVDLDGDSDVILQFETRSIGITCGATVAWVTGQTIGGLAIAGSDTIRTLCK